MYLSLSLGAHNATVEVPPQLGLSESVPILCSRVIGYHLDTPSPGRFSSEQTGRTQCFSRRSCWSVPVSYGFANLLICIIFVSDQVPSGFPGGAREFDSDAKA